MKGKQLVILIVVAAALAGLAVLTSRKEQRKNPRGAAGSKVLPGLAPRLNEIQKVVVETSDATATVARVEGLWRVPGKHGYPADFGKLRALMNKLADLKALQVLRTTPAERGDLQLLTAADSGATNAALRSTALRLLDKDAKPVGVLHLGKSRNRPAPEGAEGMGGYPDSRFVMDDQGRVMLVGDVLYELAASDKDWLDTEFLNVNAADIVDLQVSGVTNGDFRLVRPASGGELALAQPVPAGKEADTAKISRVGSALSYLRFDDVSDPGLTPDKTGLDKAVIVKARTAKGELYTLRIGGTVNGEARRHATVTVAFEAPPAPAGTTSNEAAAKAYSESTAKAAEAAKAMNAKLAPWTYLLSSYSTEALAMGLGDLLKDASKEEEKQ
jgi:hypothetical protein